MKIFVMIVMYNCRLCDSLSYMSLSKVEDCSLVICDNSTIDNDNKESAYKAGHGYVKLSGNPGLSAAYNAGIEFIRENGATEEDYLCIFDDDTNVPEDFFDKLRQAVSISHSELFLPIVNDLKGMMSPVHLRRGYPRRIKSKNELGLIQSNLLGGINSGMSIKISIYDDYRYDEGMFMDFIDYRFILDMRKKGVYPIVFNAELNQSFSAVSDEMSEAIIRYRRQRKDLKLFYKSIRLGTLTYLFVSCKRKLRMLITYKNIKVLFI